MSRLKSRSAFTLIEVLLAVGVLVLGITAVVSVYMVSLKWVEEIRVNLTALQTGRAVLADAGILLDKDDNPKGFSNRDVESKGWANDYFVVRRYDSTDTVVMPNSGGLYVHVEIEVYHGGDDTDGVLAQKIFCDQLLLDETTP